MIVFAGESLKCNASIASTFEKSNLGYWKGYEPKSINEKKKNKQLLPNHSITYQKTRQNSLIYVSKLYFCLINIA